MPGECIGWLTDQVEYNEFVELHLALPFLVDREAVCVE